MYKLIFRPFLFLFPPELSHRIVKNFLKIFFKIPGLTELFSLLWKVNDKRLNRNFLGLKFPNPVGLAAGFDKDAEMVNELAVFGFGFLEIGTATPLPQKGNPKPRLFRLKEHHSLLNRMGFNNSGVDVIASNLQSRHAGLIVGGNIGKNKDTPNDLAAGDYVKCFNSLYECVDYFAINISSPNTPELRKLQEKESLVQLIDALQFENRKRKKQKPLLVKIAPDVDFRQLDDILEVVKQKGIDGIIATNTTSSENFSESETVSINHLGNGGVSGSLLKEKSLSVIKYLKKNSDGKFIIMGAGGISSPDDALGMIKAGADLLQIYTGFIYEGPALIKKINRAILRSSS